MINLSSRYNPGGLLPEVTAQSWRMFLAILAVLLLLLALPFLVNHGMDAYRSYRSTAPKKSRVKFNEPASTSTAKGRVKMKERQNETHQKRDGSFKPSLLIQ